MSNVSPASRTACTVARVQLLSDQIQRRIIELSNRERKNIRMGYGITPEYHLNMVRLATRAIHINRYGAQLAAELGIEA